MSQFYDQSSLVFLPSGYKDGKLYSQKPLSTSGELSFSRGSDIEATRVNANGYIEKAQVNLLLQSNSFNTTWALSAGSSVTGGQTGYDGSSDAWLLTDSGASSSYCAYQSVTLTGVVAYSIYAKAGSVNKIQFDITSTATPLARINLTTGAVEASSNAIDINAENVGNGWWRVTLVGNLALPIFARFGCNGAGTIYIQDAQLNYGLVAQDYQETTTAAVVSGITNDMPRLNYDPANPTCPSLLLEPSRTNLVTQSELVTTSITNVGYTASENDATSPEGVVNAGKILETTGTTHLVQKTFSVASTTDSYAVSFFIKGIGRTRGTISYELNGAPYNSVSATFNLAEVTITNAVASGTGAVAGKSGIEPIGNDWYRITLSGVVGIPGTHFVRLFGRNDSGNTSYVGDPTKGFNVYGFQAELGSYATSYIPTYGSSATRTADSCSKTGISSLIGQTEGTIFLEVDAVNFETDQRFAISDGTSANRIALRMSTGGVIQLSVVIGSTTQASISGSGSVGNNYKIAGAYKANDFVLYINGSLAATDTSGSVSGTFSRLATDNGVSGQDFYNPIKQALLFTSRLSNADLATLTSL